MRRPTQDRFDIRTQGSVLVSIWAHAILAGGLLWAEFAKRPLDVGSAVGVEFVVISGTETGMATAADAADATGVPEPAVGAAAVDRLPRAEPSLAAETVLESTPAREPMPPPQPAVVAPRVPIFRPVARPHRTPSSGRSTPRWSPSIESSAAVVGKETGQIAAAVLAGAAASAPVAMAAPGGETRDSYLASLRRRLQSHLSYPEEARRLRLGGSVLVRFHIRADGSLDDASLLLAEPPRVDLLGDGALRTVRQSAPFGAPPMGAMAIEVPIVFLLR
jgi:periplasmic protein TonB